MNDSDKSLIKEVQQMCLLPNVTDELIYRIQDLELLIERHTQNRYDEKDYRIAFYSKALFPIVLNKDDADNIVYFLFYLLFNFPDRAGYTTHAIKKCYGYNILEACCCGIIVYMDKDDFATINLIEAIVNSYEMDELPQTVWSLFNSVRVNGLPNSRDHLEKRVFSQSS